MSDVFLILPLKAVTSVGVWLLLMLLGGALGADVMTAAHQLPVLTGTSSGANNSGVFYGHLNNCGGKQTLCCSVYTRRCSYPHFHPTFFFKLYIQRAKQGGIAVFLHVCCYPRLDWRHSVRRCNPHTRNTCTEKRSALSKVEYKIKCVKMLQFYFDAVVFFVIN